MKVYCVWGGDGGDATMEGIFSTEELAVAFKGRLEKAADSLWTDIWIDEYTVDEKARCV